MSCLPLARAFTMPSRTGPHALVNAWTFTSAAANGEGVPQSAAPAASAASSRSRLISRSAAENAPKKKDSMWIAGRRASLAPPFGAAERLTSASWVPR